MTPSKDQTTGMIERVLYGIGMFIAMKLVGLGVLDADSAPWFAGGIVTLIGGAYAWWVNRPQALMVAATAANSPQTVMAAAAAVAPTGTTIVTSPEIAAATPESPNIVSSTVHQVVPK